MCAITTETVRQSVTRQIIQNLVVFLGILFSNQWKNPGSIVRSILAFAVLTVFSYAVTVTTHAIRSRGNASESTLINTVTGWEMWLKYAALAAGILSLILRPAFAAVMILFILFSIAHDLFFEQRILLDVITLSIVFSIRAVAGVIALKHAVLSPWLVACAFLLSLVVSLGKRRNELRMADDVQAVSRARQTGYTNKLLDQMMAVVTSSTFLAYTLYTIAPRTHAVFGNTHLLYTSPFVLYGILRYLYIVNTKDMSRGSELTILRDIPMLLNIALWLTAVLIVIHIP